MYLCHTHYRSCDYSKHIINKYNIQLWYDKIYVLSKLLIASLYNQDKGVLKKAVLQKSLRPATLLKKRFPRNCFPVNFAKCLRTPFLQTTSGRLLLYQQTNRTVQQFSGMIIKSSPIYIFHSKEIRASISRTQLALACSKLIIETLEQSVKYV